MEKTNVTEVTNTGIKFVEHFKENWRWWLFAALYVFTVVIGIEFISSDAMFKRYDNYVSHKHGISTEYRIESSPIIRTYLNQLAMETGAARAYIGEYHNGKNNPSGLQWQYADMTFINDAAVVDVRDEYQNVSLVKYPLCYVLYKEGSYIGSIQDIDTIDHRMAIRLEANDVRYVGTAMMYGENLIDIGFVGVSFTDSCEIDETELRRVLYKYAARIAPYLDDAEAQKKYRERK